MKYVTMMTTFTRRSSENDEPCCNLCPDISFHNHSMSTIDWSIDVQCKMCCGAKYMQ